ncbi:hypothetical protein [Herbaspirillum sp. SJZ107]|uniref:hypothetical protein n=1 Tax=Herbaspirillum sp. SJZ107 TaxID=2572881 RepID=UPI00114DFB28|nr:hypothetical protein [Herbaspirillum sp. SJZ107]TQK02814.1 hypothetical protein FBX97_5470 [Herbaspirillum sp. SJZ107]
MRLLSLLAGGLVLVVPPMLMPMATDVPLGTVMAGILGIVMVASTFFYVGAAGRKMRRGGQARIVGAALLMVPAIAALATIATRRDEPLLWGSGALLVFTIVLFLHFVIMPTLDPRQRPMREHERERLEPSAI